MIEFFPGLGNIKKMSSCVIKLHSSVHSPFIHPLNMDTVSAAIRGCQLEEAMASVSNSVSQEALGLAEGLGDLYCKVGCYTKALEAYQTQVRGLYLSLYTTTIDLKFMNQDVM